MLSAGAGVLEGMLRRLGAGRRKEPVVCPGCGAAMKSAGLREKTLQTILGEVRLARSLFLCPGCGASRMPADEALDIQNTSLSPGLRRIGALMGAREPFRDAACDIRELAGVSLDAKAVERAARSAGEQMGSAELDRREALMLGQGLPAGKPAPVLYVAVDGTGVPARPEETAGRKGRQPDGSARTREAKLGCVFTQTALDRDGRPVRDPFSTTYAGAIEGAEKFGRRIWAEAVLRGLDRAGRVVMLGDGAPWIWNIADEHFPGAVQIVDLYHAREHLADAAKAAFSDSDPLKSPWIESASALLDAGDIEALVRKIQALRAGRMQHEKAILQEASYFSTNKKRMRYAFFKSQGFFVGSGVVEAGCKTVISQRLKLSGMRWSVRGANAIIALRCSLLSRRWNDFWDRRGDRRAA